MLDNIKSTIKYNISNHQTSISNRPSKFRTKNWIEINDQSRRTYNTNSENRFKKGDNAAARRANERNAGVYLKLVLHLLIVKLK